jgi:hypothetical protein
VFEVAPGEYADGFPFDPDEPPSEFPPSVDQVFALPGLPVLDVIEFARVGSHNAPHGELPDFSGIELANEALRRVIPREHWPSDAEQRARDAASREAILRQPRGARPWTFVRDALAEVAAICPFELQLADAAGLRGTFLRPVPAERVAEVVRLIFEVNPEVMDAVEGELSMSGQDMPMSADDPELPDYEAALRRYVGELGRIRMWWD